MDRTRRFLEQYDEDDPYAAFEQEDYSYLTQAGEDPSILLTPPTDPRQKRSGSGSLFLTGERKEGDIAAKQVGEEQADLTKKRLEAAQWGTEDEDSDRLMPQDIDGSNEKKMMSNSSGEKPPGPDSPSPDYKGGSDKWMRHAEQQKAYDAEFGPGKKHKWYSLESTRDWQHRRAMGQQDLELSRRDAADAEARELRSQPRLMGGSQYLKNGPEGPGLYGTYSDGRVKRLLATNDEDAAKTEFSDSVFYNEQGRAMVKEKGSYRTRFLEDPNMGKPLSDVVGGGMQGPVDPYVDKFRTPAQQSPTVRTVGRGQKIMEQNADGTWEEVARGDEIPAGRGGGRSEKPTESLEEQALAYAEKAVAAQLAKDEAFQKKSPAAQQAWENYLIEQKKKDWLRRRSGGAPAPATGTGGTKKKTVVDVD